MKQTKLPTINEVPLFHLEHFRNSFRLFFANWPIFVIISAIFVLFSTLYQHILPYRPWEEFVPSIAAAVDPAVPAAVSEQVPQTIEKSEAAPQETQGGQEGQVPEKPTISEIFQYFVKFSASFFAFFLLNLPLNIFHFTLLAGVIFSIYFQRHVVVPIVVRNSINSFWALCKAQAIIYSIIFLLGTVLLFGLVPAIWLFRDVPLLILLASFLVTIPVVRTYLRYIFVLPGMFLKDLPFLEARKQSFVLTHGLKLSLATTSSVMFLVAGIISVAFDLMIKLALSTLLSLTASAEKGGEVELSSFSWQLVNLITTTVSVSFFVPVFILMLLYYLNAGNAWLSAGRSKEGARQ